MENSKLSEAGTPSASGGKGMTRRTLLWCGFAMSPVLVLGARGGFGSQKTATSGASATAARSGQIFSGCVLTPQQTEGPYFVDEMLNRSDIRPYRWHAEGWRSAAPGVSHFGRNGRRLRSTRRGGRGRLAL